MNALLGAATTVVVARPKAGAVVGIQIASGSETSFRERWFDSTSPAHTM